MLRTDTKLSGWTVLLLGLLPFVLLIGGYMFEAYHIRAVEAADGPDAAASSKLVPTFTQMWEGFKSSAVERDEKGDLRLWVDTWASIKRFGLGMLIVSLVGVVVGLYMGVFPFAEALLARFFVFMDKVPPLLLLPILFILFGVGEFSKVMLVIVGVLPGIVLDAYLRAKEIHREQFYKAQSLGASEQEIAWSVVFPQIFPKMLDTIRLNFKAAWGYVIAGESIAAAVGLGYRIFILRKYAAMDVIIPYVLWATLIMFALDFLFQWWIKQYRWVGK